MLVRTWVIVNRRCPAIWPVTAVLMCLQVSLLDVSLSAEGAFVGFSILKLVYRKRMQAVATLEEGVQVRANQSTSRIWTLAEKGIIVGYVAFF